MSHVTTLDTIPFKDSRAIMAAVEELKQKGVKCELKTNSTCRLYYRDQVTALGKCEYVIHLPGQRFDVGLKARYDENNNFVQYDAYFDTHAGYVAKELGRASVKAGEDAKVASISKFSQTYTKYATIHAAEAQGFQVRSVEYDEEENVQLVLARYA